MGGVTDGPTDRTEQPRDGRTLSLIDLQGRASKNISSDTEKYKSGLKSRNGVGFGRPDGNSF